MKKSIDDLVMEVLLDEYGEENEQRKFLGELYDEVIERLKELERIAEETKQGKWGFGWNREQALNGAGYNYAIVQFILNRNANKY